MENELLRNLYLGQFLLKVQEFKDRHLNKDEDLICRFEDYNVLTFVFTVNSVNPTYVSVYLSEDTVTMEYVYKILYVGLRRLRDTYMKPIPLLTPEEYKAAKATIQQSFSKKENE